MIRSLWFDPSTPTESQRADSILKLKSEGVLSREGAWDELGWDEARKDRERAYFAAEQRDPILEKIAANQARAGGLNGGDADGSQ